MMKIDENSPKHAYVQLAALLREQIAAGETTVKLPSLTELAAETHPAVGTIRRAIDVLVRERLVRTVQGRETFLTPPGDRRARRWPNGQAPGQGGVSASGHSADTGENQSVGRCTVLA